MRKRELIALLKLSFLSLVTVNFMGYFLAVPWVGVQCAIVVCLDHTHVLFQRKKYNIFGNYNL